MLSCAQDHNHDIGIFIGIFDDLLVMVRVQRYRNVNPYVFLLAKILKVCKR